MKCQSCHKENREQARYCRFCGTELSVQTAEATAAPALPDTAGDEFAHLVGLDTAKRQVREMVATLKAIIQQRGKGALNAVNANILITGPSGTGKSEFTHALTDTLTNNGMLKDEEYEFFTPWNIDGCNLAEHPLKGIIIEDAEKMLPANKEDSLATCPLGYIIENARAQLSLSDERLQLILNGSQELQDYIDTHPDLKSLFALNIRLPEYTPTEVTAICDWILHSKHQLKLLPASHEKLCRVFNHERRHAEQFGNAHLAEAKANEILMKATARCLPKKPATVMPEDITGKEFIPKTLDDVMKEFDKYVGVDEIKSTLIDIVHSITAYKKLHPDKVYEVKDHFLFLGNPGTGKTTMARVFADALSALGILPSGQLVEVAAKDLIGQYLGHTGPKVDAAFDRAMGGVLFIDEAYDLQKNEGDQFGTEAVTALIKNVEDRRGKLVVILAGYPKEMAQFATYNPGIPSRFNETVNFRDYNGAEMTEIARRMVRAQGYSLDAHADKVIGQHFDKLYISRNKDFANARDVRNAVEKAIKNHNTRIAKASREPDFDPATEFSLSMADFTGEDQKPPKTVDEVLASLDDLVGMDDIKKEIRKIANTAIINRMRMESGLGAATLQPVNIILTGNPGTGKTTIAKRLGEVLHAAGVLPSEKVVEREKKTLLDSYVNSAGINMNKAVDEAMGGVLFIDEAYNLLPQPGSPNQSGNEALDALMTRMENDKGKFVVVIAGYQDRMEELIRRGNPGLMSRFNKKFHIDDYEADALTEIYLGATRKRKLHLTDSAINALHRRMESMVANKGLHFGNARDAINLLNQTVENQSNRLSENMDTDYLLSHPEALITIEAEDIPQEH